MRSETASSLNDGVSFAVYFPLTSSYALCQCEVTGSFLSPKFFQGRDFLCLLDASPVGDVFGGKVVGSRIKNGRYFQVSDNASHHSYVFECEPDPSC